VVQNQRQRPSELLVRGGIWEDLRFRAEGAIRFVTKDFDCSVLLTANTLFSLDHAPIPVLQEGIAVLCIQPSR
jgi:hypothetical protein